MKTLHRTFRWLIALVLLGGAAAAAGSYYYWNQSDEWLRQMVLAKLHETAPGWNVEIGRARFDFSGRIRLYDLKLRIPDNTSPLLEIPEAIVVVDREKIAEKHPPVHQVRLLGMQVQAVRDPQGKWNWDGLPERPKLGGTLSEWQIEQATLTVRLENANGPAATTVLRDVDAQFIPSGKRQYLIKGTGQFELANRVTLDGQWNLDSRAWSVGGELKELKVGPVLSEMLTTMSPEFRAGLTRAEEWAARFGPTVGNPDDDSKQAVEGVTSPGQATPLPAAFGVNAAVDLRFRVMQWQPDAECEYKIAVQINQGEVTNPLLPFALYDLRGNIAFDNRQIAFTDLTARNGTTQLNVGGKVTTRGGLRPAELTVSVQDLVLEPRVRACLPDECGKTYDSLQPAGKVDLAVKLDFDGRDRWETETDLTVKTCTLIHQKFPYRIDQVEGTIKQRGDLLDFTLRGLAGQRPVTLRGRVKDPGPEAESVFDIRVNELPLDERFRAACPAKVQTALDALRMEGSFDGTLVLMRPAGPGQKFTPFVTAHLRNCSTTPRSFPYAIHKVSGLVEGAGDHWKFSRLKGVHDAAAVEASGTFEPDERGDGHLDLHVNVTEAAFDPQLKAALPDGWKMVWTEFNPTGLLSAAGRVEWTHGQGPAISLDAKLVNAGLTMKSFPWPLEKVQAQVGLKGGVLTIASLEGRHEETRVSMTGDGWFQPDRSWLVHLEDLRVDDLDPDNRFKTALPPKLRNVVETLNPRKGKLSATGMLEFRGTGRPIDAVTAAWELETIYSGATLTAGIDLENLHGRVRLRGTWDGERVIGSGKIDLDSLSFRGYQLTQVRGPVSVNGTRLVLGSEDVVSGNTPAEGPAAVNRADRLTAKFIDGVLALDGFAVLEGRTEYRVLMTLTGGRLERFAQLYLPGRDKLMGVMNGWVDLKGRGPEADRLSGKGQLLIAPAALYELPVIVAIFNVLRFVPPDKTAFTNALVDFEIGNSQFLFHRIELQGDSVSLQGRGKVGFDGRVSLKFYSKAGRYQVPIPLVREMLAEATKGWVGIEVKGTTKAPVATYQAVPQMDDALRSFLGAFDTRPAVTRPAARERPAGKR